jgi:hypothetical protein
MKEIEVSRSDFKPVRGEAEYAEPPGKDSVVLTDHLGIDAETGCPVIAHSTVDFGEIGEALFEWAPHMPWKGEGSSKNEVRLSGINNAHVIFGYAAPVPMRRRWAASSTAFNREYPKAAYALEVLAAQCSDWFEANLPEAYENHLQAIDGLHDGWKLAGRAPWSSGIINKSAALRYHRDSGNSVGSWSAMIVMRKGVGGGLLHVRDLDVYLACDHMSLSIFDGQALTHGVTPLVHSEDPEEIRISIVFYTKTGIVRAEAPGDEIIRGQIRASRGIEE